MRTAYPKGPVVDWNVAIRPHERHRNCIRPQRSRSEAASERPFGATSIAVCVTRSIGVIITAATYLTLTPGVPLVEVCSCCINSAAEARPSGTVGTRHCAP